MNMNMIYRVLVYVIFFICLGCSSAKFVPSTDVCSIKKHWKDNVFQVLVNNKAINKHYYTYQEAKNLKYQLHLDNKCMK